MTNATPTTGTTAEPAGTARFQAVSDKINATAAQSPVTLTPAAPTAPPAGTSSTGTTAPTPAKTFVDELKEAPEEAMNALESRITELEAVVHRLASSADGTHTGIGAWLKKVGARLEAAVKKL